MKIEFNDIPSNQAEIEQTKLRCHAVLRDHQAQPKVIETNQWKLMLSLFLKESKFYMIISILSTIFLLIFTYMTPDNPYIFIFYSLFNSLAASYTLYIYGYYMDEILHPTLLSKSKKFVNRSILLNLIIMIDLIILYLFSGTTLSLHHYLTASFLPLLVCNCVSSILHSFSDHLTAFIIFYTLMGLIIFISYEMLELTISMYAIPITMILFLCYLMELLLIASYMRKEEHVCCK